LTIFSSVNIRSNTRQIRIMIDLIRSENMQSPSRLMPPFVAPTVKWWRRIIGSIALAGLVIWYAWMIWKRPIPSLGTIAVFTVVVVIEEHRFRAHLREVAGTRKGESICSYARALPVRELDSWVVRAVFEQLQALILGRCPSFPIRPSDRLYKDLKVDPDDVDWQLAVEIAQRTGRSLRDCRANPFYGKVVTVEDMIRFFCAQQERAVR
jgi:hypothetical protein